MGPPVLDATTRPPPAEPHKNGRPGVISVPPPLARSALSAAAPSHQQIAPRYRAQYLSVLARCGGEIVGLAGVGREPPYRPALLLTLVLKVVIGGVRL